MKNTSCLLLLLLALTITGCDLIGDILEFSLWVVLIIVVVVVLLVVGIIKAFFD